MEYEYEPANYDPHEECVSTDDVVPYVFENHWAEVEEAVSDARGKSWLADTRPCLELLTIISQRDREHMRGAIKKWLRKRQTAGDEPTEEQLFSIAADVSAFLEQLPQSFPLPPVVYDIDINGYQGVDQPSAARCIGFSSGTCNLDADLSWAKDLLELSRAFRDFLSAISDPELKEPYLRLRITGSMRLFNHFLQKTPAQLLIYWQGADKQPRFGRCPDPQVSSLSSLLANWISDYLTDHYSSVGLGVCVECGKFFVRERRDRTFCSKTCQNKIAYKRRKILESDALEQINIAANDACDIEPGLWIHHPRLGLGLVENLSSRNSSIPPVLARAATNVDTVKYRLMLSRKLLLQIRFLHGVRVLGYTDLFEGQKREDQLPTFYRVKSEETLAELL
jgi:hypothetical protein